MNFEFQFPTNGKAHVNSTPLQPSQDGGRYAQNQTRTARRIFFPKNSPSKSHKPLQTLTQTRFFGKTALKVRHPLGSWAISVVFASDPRIAFVFINIHTIWKNVKSFSRIFAGKPNAPRVGQFSIHAWQAKIAISQVSRIRLRRL